MALLDRDTLRNLMSQWASGRLTEGEVHEQAEVMLETVTEDELNAVRTDPRSIAVEVIIQLDILNIQLITPADVPAILEFLATAPGNELIGWDRWQEYWERVDFENRKKLLTGNPYYSA